METMKNREYTVHYEGETLKIEGNGYADAIDKNIWPIGKLMKLGNVAGFEVEAASIKYDPDILDGKGGGVFVITACGADSAVGYDAIADVAVTKTAYIEGITSEELPEIDIIELRKIEPYNPLTADISTLSRGGRYGTAWAIYSFVAAERSRTKDPYIVGKIVVKASSMELHQPMQFTQKMRELMMRCAPYNDAFTQRLINRADELVMGIDPSKNLFGEYDSPMKEALTRNFLQRYGKTTALKYYREKMGATGQQIADATGISLRQYWRYENGEGDLGNAANNVVVALAKALGVKTSAIVESWGTRYVDKQGK